MVTSLSMGYLLFIEILWGKGRWKEYFVSEGKAICHLHRKRLKAYDDNSCWRAGSLPCLWLWSSEHCLSLLKSLGEGADGFHSLMAISRGPQLESKVPSMNITRMANGKCFIYHASIPLFTVDFSLQRYNLMKKSKKGKKCCQLTALSLIFKFKGIVR